MVTKVKIMYVIKVIILDICFYNFCSSCLSELIFKVGMGTDRFHTRTCPGMISFTTRSALLAVAIACTSVSMNSR